MEDYKEMKNTMAQDLELALKGCGVDKEMILSAFTDACRYRWIRNGYSETLFVEHDNDERQHCLNGAELDKIIDEETDAHMKAIGVEVDKASI